MLTTLIAATLISASPQSATAKPAQKPASKPIVAAQDTPAQFDARTKWWRDAKLGMFIHWGIYSVPAGEWNGVKTTSIAEWIMDSLKIPIPEYEKFAARFNPVKFDARKWVGIAKDAGMKYIVITSKHHDGFCMFDSKLTNYDIADAGPFKRDILKELAVECKRQGIRLCFYHSIMDWHHPDAKGANFPKYVEHLRGQLKELVTNYGDIGVLWFDGEWIREWTPELGESTYKYLRQLKPDIIINNRVGKGRQGMAGGTAKGSFGGDFGTPEQEVPATGIPGELWESCMTMNDTWGFNKDDHNWKSAPQLLHTLIDIASKGGNFLLNVGPTSEGLIPQASVERLSAMGKWMQVNSTSVYGTTASPFKRLPFDGRCTVKGNTVYLHVFNWPDAGLTLSGLSTPVISARALANGEKLRVVRPVAADPVLYIGKPTHIDPVATVIEIRLAAKPVVSQTTPALKAASDGSLMLMAADAEVHGQSARLEHEGEQQCIGFWTNATDYVGWTVEVPKAGLYTLDVRDACTPENAGSKFEVATGAKAKCSGTVASTGSWSAFKTEKLGTVDLTSGRQEVTVKATEMPRGAVMNLRAVRLAPVK